jgi:prepilin-type processing-associated H-X9-DG protein
MRFKTHNTTAPVRETDAQQRHSHAFTLIELLTIVAIVVILTGLLLPSGTSCKAKAPRIKCVNNLKNVGLAFRIYSADNNDRFPWQISDKSPAAIYSADPATYIRRVTNELSTPALLHCADDTRAIITNWTQFTRANLSYFISPDAAEILPQSFLAGDRNITNQHGRLRPGLRALSRTNNIAGWDETIHKNQGNAAMGDGSVQQLSTARLREQLRNTGHTTKYLKLSVP